MSQDKNTSEKKKPPELSERTSVVLRQKMWKTKNFLQLAPFSW